MRTTGLEETDGEGACATEEGGGLMLGGRRVGGVMDVCGRKLSLDGEGRPS